MYSCVCVGMIHGRPSQACMHVFRCVCVCMCVVYIHELAEMVRVDFCSTELCRARIFGDNNSTCMHTCIGVCINVCMLSMYVCILLLY